MTLLNVQKCHFLFIQKNGDNFFTKCLHSKRFFLYNLLLCHNHIAVSHAFDKAFTLDFLMHFQQIFKTGFN